MENEDFKGEIKKINDKLTKEGSDWGPTLVGGYGSGEIPTIEVKIFDFDVFDKKIYIVSTSQNYPYIKYYIESIISGKPDKEGTFRKYALESDDSRFDNIKIDELLTIFKDKLDRFPIAISGELNKVDESLSSILNAIKREKKIDNLLSDSNGDIES